MKFKVVLIEPLAVIVIVIVIVKNIIKQKKSVLYDLSTKEAELSNNLEDMDMDIVNLLLEEAGARKKGREGTCNANDKESRTSSFLAIEDGELIVKKKPMRYFAALWLLGTRQAKLDRRKANKLDIARLCEEILNPPVPMALRLSSILMGGVVILYERKVMFLHDDANRFLVMEERTLLPKGRAKAKRKSITLPENEETSMGFTNVGEPEEEISMGFKPNIFNMQLDQVEDYYITSDPMEDNMANDHHQADDNDITLTDLIQPNTNIHGRFERFEEGDEGTQLNFTLDEHIEIPPTPIPSPVRQAEPQRAGGSQEQYPENNLGQQFKRNKEARDQQRQGLGKQKTRKPKGIITDEEQTVISNHVYHSWLHDTSDIGPKSDPSSLKIAKLMELPSVVLMDDMFAKGNQEIPYPEPLLDLWKKGNQPHDGSPSVRNSSLQLQPQPLEPSSTERVHSDHPMDYPFEDLHSGVGSPSHVAAVELLRSKGTKVTPVNINHFVSSGNSGDGVRSTGSSVFGDGIPLDNLEVKLERVGSKKNVPSTSRNNSGLDTVHEAFCEADTVYKLTRPGRENLAPDPDFIVVTQLTKETPADDPAPDIMTENIKTHMKTHFETPGAPRVESLQNLAAGLTRKGAAQLFYQTCVLASQGFLRVQQEVPFGEISISKGAKM
ncbi:hypothetical protein V6N13_043209 [Hibiscus sabdariffa]